MAVTSSVDGGEYTHPSDAPATLRTMFCARFHFRRSLALRSYRDALGLRAEWRSMTQPGTDRSVLVNGHVVLTHTVPINGEFSGRTSEAYGRS